MVINIDRWAHIDGWIGIQTDRGGEEISCQSVKEIIKLEKSPFGNYHRNTWFRQDTSVDVKTSEW